MPVDIHFKIEGFGNVGITEDTQVMDGSMDVQTQWWVNLADGSRVMAAQVTLVDFSVGFTAIVTNMVVALNIDKIKDTKVQVDSCAYGTVNAFIFKQKLNLFFTTFKVFINGWLAGLQIEVPSDIAGIFELSDLYIEYYNDYIYAGATPTFIGNHVEAAALLHKYSPEEIFTQM